MTKPQSQPSYFKLEVEGRERNSSGNLPSHFHHPFNSNLQAPEIPALPVDNLIPPALTSKATPSAAGNLPVSSTGEMIPSITSSDPVIQSLQHDPANQTREFHQ